MSIAAEIDPLNHEKAVSNYESGDAASIAALIDAVAPQDAAVPSAEVAENPWAAFDQHEGTSSLPTGDVGIAFDQEAEPVEVVDDLAISTDESRDLDLVHRPTEQGEQFLTVLGSEEAPTELSYELDLPKGAELKQLDDGSIKISAPAESEIALPGEDARIESAAADVVGAEITSFDAIDNLTDEQVEQLAAIPDVETETVVEMQPLATIEAPWAVDGAGKSVDTHYTLEGNTLTQTVEITADTTFPVVADPSWKWWLEKGAKCLGGVVSIGAFGYAKISLGIAKLVIKMSKASKTSKLGKAYSAWKKLGTSNSSRFNQMVTQMKSFAQLVVRKGAPSAFATHRKKSTKAAAALTLIKEGTTVVAGVFGLGSCYDILREVWR
ncbi:hypothetical protein [Glutamicibacter arilaitensis]|uniref:hypothetical protein n=1 Tax=Glutamicibacter arilaitensis TaxID=256701 RepID=UPI00385152BC